MPRRPHAGRGVRCTVHPAEAHAKSEKGASAEPLPVRSAPSSTSLCRPLDGRAYSYGEGEGQAPLAFRDTFPGARQLALHGVDRAVDRGFDRKIAGVDQRGVLGLPERGRLAR